MRDEPEDQPNDPFDGELDSAMITAVELVAHVKRMQSVEVELPILDESCLWMVTVKRMGIREDG
jgi:hypothetical protein